MQNATPREGRRTAAPIAVQMYTLRDYGTLEEQLALVAEVGYRAVETVGTHGVEADELKRLLDGHGLEVASSHVALDALRDDLEGAVAFHRAVGNDTLVVPFLAEPARPRDAAGWRELGRELDGIGARLRREGMRLAYHNHAFELTEVDGRLALDHMLGAAEPGNLGWEADVAWIARGGRDPSELLERYAGRIPVLHAKDNAPEGEAQDQGGFADVGHGVLDWARLLPAARDAGVAWYVVEHDMPAEHERSIARSFAYLDEKLPGVLADA